MKKRFFKLTSFLPMSVVFVYFLFDIYLTLKDIEGPMFTNNHTSSNYGNAMGAMTGTTFIVLFMLIDNFLFKKKKIKLLFSSDNRGYLIGVLVMLSIFIIENLVIIRFIINNKLV
ncbi:hypothetical protein [Vagococcus silagei]|uniref:Uncharacterized protein n=1 Tax=Vagococcus silagei TaxID=2508885 RepID=A0A4S3B326_9ENTE|nr:hypothetical protein [Vagococcus silagei]THB61242.1 hypothetical protein ESZ54_05715 [Vagococcus silagei]